MTEMQILPEIHRPHFAAPKRSPLANSTQETDREKKEGQHKVPDLNKSENDSIANDRKIVLYRKGREIDGTNYIIEISKKIT